MLRFMIFYHLSQRFFMLSKRRKAGRIARRDDIRKLAVQFFAKNGNAMLSFQDGNGSVICLQKVYYD